MGRTRLFNRTEVLEKALPLFWKQGFSATGLHDIEEATGVNKSGLYSEFKDKEDLFLSSLKHYFETRGYKSVLTKEPFGWANIESFFKLKIRVATGEEKGCFGVNCLREVDQLTPAVQQIVTDNRNQLKRLFIKNIAAEKTTAAPEAISEIVSTFFSGFCIEQNLQLSTASLMRKIDDFIRSVKLL